MGSVRILRVAMVVFLSAGAGFLLGQMGRDIDTSYLQALVRRDRAAEERYKELQAQLVDARLALDVDRQATQSLRDTITSLREEIASLRDEATLYRNMLAPEQGESGIRIAECELTAGDVPGEFRYFLLLSRSQSDGEPVHGGMELVIRGSLVESPEREVVLSLRDVAAPATYPVPFRFRYLQGLSGLITLPDSFVPTQLRVTLTQAGQGKGTREAYDWQQVLE